jgi:ubiquitin fusion degradation protein 1
MLFEVHNAAAERTSHCGVLEFIAEEGMIYMPYWVCQDLGYCCTSLLYHHVNKANFMWSSDDAKSSSARGRYGVHKKRQPPQGHICEVAASYNRLSRYFKPQGNVSIFSLTISYPSENILLPFPSHMTAVFCLGLHGISSD